MKGQTTTGGAVPRTMAPTPRPPPHGREPEAATRSGQAPPAAPKRKAPPSAPPRAAELLLEIEAPLGEAATAATLQVERLRALKEQLGVLAGPPPQDLLTALDESGELLVQRLAQAAHLLRQHRSQGANPAAAAMSAPADALDPAPSSVSSQGTAAPPSDPPLASALQRALHTRLARFSDQGIASVLEVEPGIGPAGSAEDWSQVLAVLVANSAQHGFGGRCCGEIRITVRRNGARLLRLVYEDDGVGLSPAAREHAFRRRYTSRAAEGARGLGLCTLRDVVHARLSGAVSLLVTPVGAAFAIDVPVGPTASAR